MQKLHPDLAIGAPRLRVTPVAEGAGTLNRLGHWLWSGASSCTEGGANRGKK